MHTASTPELDLTEAWLDSDPRKRVCAHLPDQPLHRRGAHRRRLLRGPARRPARHATPTAPRRSSTSSPARARPQVGDERGRVRAGDLAVIPAMAPHGIANTATSPCKVVGFFCEREITSTFDAPLQPVGVATVTTGVPVLA